MIRDLSRRIVRLGALTVVALYGPSATAQNGNWITATSGVYNWSAASNWQSGIVANGANNTATFATAGLTGAMTISLDFPPTIGSVVFDNPTNSFGWNVEGPNALVLSNSAPGGPSIAVNNSAITTTMSVLLAGTQGFTKTGPGTLVLSGNNSTLTGGIAVAAGVLSVNTTSTSPLGANVVTLSGGTLQLGTGIGFNQKMVVPPGFSFANSGITATMDGGAALTGYTYNAVGANTAAPAAGLPMGTTFTSMDGSGRVFTLQPANVNNALLLDAGDTTGHFVLTSPVPLSTMSFLTASGAGPGTITATFHFTDGSPDVVSTFQSPDWVTGSTGTALANTGRVSASGFATGGNLFDETVTLANTTSPVGSVDVSWSGGSTTHTAIFGLTTPVLTADPTANFAGNNVVVTANSGIKVTAPSATLGNLAIGANTLNLTGNALTFGAVTLSGNPTFNIGSGMTATMGAFSDGGVVRAITESGMGTMVVGAASPGLSPGTGVVVNGGTLNLNSATGFGPSPNVTINNGTINLAASLNPTFASLNGIGGTLSLNGNVLTLGSVSGAFSGTITGVGPASLVKAGVGTQTLTGANTYAGGTTINAGTLVASPGALGTGAVTLMGGTLAVGPTLTPNGFGSGSGWTTNGTASFPQQNVLQLTPAAGGTGIAWLSTPIATSAPFTIKFTVVKPLNVSLSGGMTVGFQSAGTAALGSAGGFGYAGIMPSAALALNFDAANTQGGAGSGFGVLTNGANPSTIEPMPSTAPVNLNLFNLTNVTINYDGANLSFVAVQGPNSFISPALPLNIAGTVGSSALFGFTAGTTGVLSQLQISNLSFAGPGYNSPTTPTPGIYANNVVVTNSSTIQVTAPAGVPTVAMGTLTMGSGTMLTITPDSSNPAGAPFGLTFTGATLNGANTISEAAAGTLSLGPITSVGAASLTVVGGGSLTVSGGAIPGRLDLGASSLSLGGASFSVGSLAGIGGTLSGNAAAPIMLTVGSDNTSAIYSGSIVDGSAGALSLTKMGTGTLTLTGTNSYSGGTAINDGTLAVASDAALGGGPVSIGAFATLNYSASAATSRSFINITGTIAVAKGAVLTLNGGTVTGGYLGGAGTFSTDAVNGARFANMTSLASATIVSNGATDRFVDFTNSGSLTVAAGINTDGSSRTVSFSGFTNQGSGSITTGAGSRINVANFQSYGTLTLNPAVVGSGQETLFTNVGSSPLGFNSGSETYVGTLATAGPPGHPNNVAGIDIHGQNLVLNGALLVNNGTLVDSVGGGNLIVNYGAFYKGAGNTLVNVITQDGGAIGLGSPAASSFGSLTLGPGGIQNLAWPINDARGTAGPAGAAGTLVRGWGQLQANIVTNPITNSTSTGNLTWTASSTPGSQFDLALITLLAPSPIGGDGNQGQMDDFHVRLTAPPGADDGNQSFVWPLITYQGIYTGPTDSATLTADTLFDASQFANSHPGTFSIQLDQANEALDLVYTAPVPEPGTLLLVGAAGIGLLQAFRRRRRAVHGRPAA